MFYDKNEEIARLRQGGLGRRNGPLRGGRHGLHSGRKLSSGDLQLVLLALLEKNASHGYELIKSLEERSDGFYVPSPGMIYPSLTYLVELGHADVETEGNKKRYRLTEDGLGHLNQNRPQAERILEDLTQIGARMEDARRALAGERDLGESLEGQSEALRNVRHELKVFLRSFEPANRTEDERVTRILRAALEEIRTPSSL